jgi:hypothetical protein
MPTDTTRTIEIAGSPGKMIILVGIGVLMTAASAAIAFRLIPDLDPDVVMVFIGYVGVLFFGLCTIIIAWRLLSTRGPVVTITPEGIRDTRVAAELVPWSGIKGMSTWEYAGQKVLVLAVEPAVERKLTLTMIARWSRRPNRALGADGLCVTAQGLKTDYETLFRTCVDYAEAGWPQA